MTASCTADRRVFARPCRRPAGWAAALPSRRYAEINACGSAMTHGQVRHRQLLALEEAAVQGGFTSFG